MKIIPHLEQSFGNYQQLNNQFVGTPPYPMIVLDNFLPYDFAKSMQQEVDEIPSQYWTEFTRKNSYMRECTNMAPCAKANQLAMEIHSQAGMTWLTKLTGIKDLIPDPYLVGAGYSQSFAGDSLKIHTDFNWNDKIRVHRMASLILYLSDEDWQEDWGGHIQFKDFNNKEVVQNVSPLFNRAVIWRHHKRGFHGYPDPMTCPADRSRKTFRIFFYVSNAEYDSSDRPHRSLYWFDDENGEPYDIVSQK